ncbi:MAG: undecaprenyldiphospho-muramoylpentapeptide beta-N-acetylglucosaminyltransferase [Bacteroidales bacterium]|nr:undecaprenyldiphospho-muramoylpentapeptide beta-N-acetylglucosaminyltransferase [Bacteroidales bacterium]
MKKALKVIISGGGTGGHIFPALSIANAIKERFSDAEILFVGAEGRMEMEKVPAAGYRIIGLPISGFDRKNLLRNIPVLFRLLRSMIIAYFSIRRFHPDIAIGVGGYASAPTLRMASLMGIPTIIQEQNSYAGVTNKMLAKKASKICVAYPNMERFFPAEKIVVTGNPVRKDVLDIEGKRDEAIAFFGLDKSKKTLLVLGGSLGARTINNSVKAGIKMIQEDTDVQVIWQCGKFYYDEMSSLSELKKSKNIHLCAFISRMDLAYAAADMIISRAGAGSISEFCLLHKPVILVPSPNVAEDHQTVNAQSLTKVKAAIMVADVSAENSLVDIALTTLHDEGRLKELSENITKMALPDSANKIVDEVVSIVEKREL